MPERFSSEIPASAAMSASAFEDGTRLDVQKGNPDLIPFETIDATNAAKSFAESSHPNIEQVPTPHGAARILTHYVIRLRRSKQSEQSVPQAPNPPTQDDLDLVG